MAKAETRGRLFVRTGKSTDNGNSSQVLRISTIPLVVFVYIVHCLFILFNGFMLSEVMCWYCL